MKLTVYLAGEIHTSWREEVKQKVAALNLPDRFCRTDGRSRSLR